MMAPTDDDLLRMWRQGDRMAGTRLLRRHFHALYRFFATKVDRGAEDLVQRTFLTCVEHLDDVGRGSSVRAYLFGIARKKLLHHFRERKRDPGELDFSRISVHRLTGASPSEWIAARRREQELLRAMRRLPVDLQIALELQHWEELSIPEIGEILEIPPGTVKSRLHRARILLKREIMSEPVAARRDSRRRSAAASGASA